MSSGRMVSTRYQCIGIGIYIYIHCKCIHIHLPRLQELGEIRTSAFHAICHRMLLLSKSKVHACEH